MNFSGINEESVVDGKGVRVVLYVSGCKHGCKGCHNPDTHDFNNGEIFDDTIQDYIIKSLNKSYISGLTISGGDPMFSAAELIPFVNKIRAAYGDTKNIWIYSGYKIEEITDTTMYELLKLCDVLVDGRFELDKKTIIAPFRGSSNQRALDISAWVNDRVIREVI